jgi:hypothetical protein
MAPRKATIATVAIVVALSAASTAGAVTSQPVAGTVPDRPVGAARDGAGVLVLTKGGVELRVSRVSRGRVGPPQMITRDRRVRQAYVLTSPRGSAVVLWSTNGEILASRRPTRSARFGPARMVSRHPGAATGAAAGLMAASAPDGRVLAAWWGGPAGGRLGIQTAELGVDGTWSAPVDASGGTYPPPALTTWSSPPVGASFAPGDGGGWVVGWTEATGPLGVTPPSTLVTTRRTGSTWEPTVRQPVGELWSPPVILGTGTEIVAAWVEGRGRRPDGVAADVCLVASRTVGATSTRRELGCRPSGIGVGGSKRLARTSGGGSALTWSVTGQPGLAAETFARAAGSDEWSAPALAIAGSRGSVQIEELQTVDGARTALVTQNVLPVFPRDLGRLRIALLEPGGAVSRRADGPPTPGKPGSVNVVYLPLGSAGPQGIVLWPLASAPLRYRAALMDLGAG